MANAVAAWPTLSLGEVVRQRKEFIQINDLAEYKRCRVRLHAQGIVLRDVVAGAEVKTKSQQVCRAGEFLVAEIDAKVGGFGIVPEALEGAIVSSHYFLFSIDETRLDQRFLGYYIRTHDFLDQVEAQGSTNYAAIRPADVQRYAMPLPPLDEQRRIVARIEELAARIEEAKGLRREAMVEAEAIRRSGLSQQFSNLENSFEPIRLDSIAECRLGKMLSQQAKTGAHSTPYLRNANVQWDRLDLTDVFEMDFNEEEQVTFRLIRGDILVCEGGDIGKAAIWNDEIAGCCYQKALHRVRVNKGLALPRFILYHIFWHAQQGHFEDVKTQTTIAHLTGVKLKASQVYVPPLRMQELVVNQLDELNARVDALNLAQRETASEIKALLSSVLDKAFRGEL